MAKTNNAININAAGIPVYNGAGIFYSNTTTQYSVLVGGVATSPIVSIGAAATSGVPLISQGASANPAFGTAVVAGGGTGRSSASVYAPICGGTVTTGAYQSAFTGLSFTGYALVSNGPSAVPSFTAVANSVTGTANQVYVNGTSGSPKTGALTFSTPQDIATSSIVQFGKVGVNVTASNNYLSVNGAASIGYADTEAPTDGLIVKGAAGFGNSNLGSYHYIWGQSYTVHDHIIVLQGSLVGQATVNAKSGIYVNPSLEPSYSLAPVVFVAGQTITPEFAPAAGCTITDAYGLNIRYGLRSGTGVVTRGTSLWVGKPLYGNSRYTAYFDPLVGIGETEPTSALHCSTSSFTTSNTQYIFGGEHDGLDSSGNKISFYVNPTLAPTYQGTLTAAAAEWITPTFAPEDECIITSAYGLYISIGIAGARGGTVTNGYGLYVNNPAFGVNQYTARFDSGVGIGANPVASAALQVQSTTKGFLPPVMTTAQKNAISTPAEGLMVYDNQLNAICFWTGAAWRTLTGV